MGRNNYFGSRFNNRTPVGPVRCGCCGEPDPSTCEDGYSTCCNKTLRWPGDEGYAEAKRECDEAIAHQAAWRAKQAAKSEPEPTPATETPKADRADKAHAYLEANGWSSSKDVAAHLGLTGRYASQAAVATLTGLCKAGRAWKAKHAGKTVYTAR